MRIRWRELFIAIIMAIGLWYGINGSEKIETQIEVRVDYRGIPANLAVYDGLINKVNVRVKASGGQLATLYNRDSASFLIDLSGLVRGENTIPLSISQVHFSGGVEVIDVTPSAIVLAVDTVATKDVPVSVDYRNFSKDQKNSQLTTVIPDHVTVKGPALLVDSIDTLSVQPSVNGTTGKIVSRQKKMLTVPDPITVTPPQVEIVVSSSLKNENIDE